MVLLNGDDRPPVLDKSRLATVHVDLDGGTHIFRAHGWNPGFQRDALFASGLRRAMAFFAQRRITATLFVIAEDLADPEKRTLIVEASAQGHEIASHTMTHRHLTALAPDERRKELRDSRDALEQVVGKRITGFRAPGFRLDHETLVMVAEAGYRYDSSAFSGSRSPAGAITLDARVESLERESGLRELAMPSYDGLPWPFHPSYSLLLGTRYFRGMVDKFGSFEYALAAYNAGSDRVDDWLKLGKYRDPQEFVESIPFTETREYVQAILRNENVYRQLYGTP